MSLFETGPVVMTIGVREIMMSGAQATDVIQSCLDRHCNGDWGDLCDEDKEMNDQALEVER